MKRLAVLILASACGLFAAPASALLETCTVAALPTSFGSYNPQNASPTNTTGQVTVTCTALVSISVNYTIKLSTGGAGTYSPRYMSLGGNHLQYNLYTASNYAAVWGNGTGGSSTVSDGYALGLLLVVRNYPVYARLFAQQNVPAGAYTDTIIVTVDY